MFEVSSQFIILIPVVIGVVHAMKMAGLPSRFAPVCSLALGVSAVVFFDYASFDSVLEGLVVGLSASGLWSGVKSTLSEG